ncbi:hypothetical protein SCHPADRAFT_904862 [Schizopora paradoxa]|uniref:TFIIS central domain-containing protein n=1 Tax=Schizopora paradoxa TaxID=27342 RepID=A0A0H2RL78_9AGAM|nr:hypothetical protein SCHPADRAFT_904862 [Schizopora paradoxa]
MPEEVESDESDEGSEDDYVAETENRRKGSIGKRTARRISFSSDKSDSEDDHERPKRIARRGTVSEKASAKRKSSLHSPALDDAAALKRRGSLLASSSSKKARTASDTPSGDDPMRKYCLTKLNEIIRPMFVEHRLAEKKAFVPVSTDLAEAEIATEAPKTEPTEEETKEMEQNATAFVTQLEACMMDEYAEPDKTGRPHAGGKYKERFRMLSFNLAKDDRIALRKGIASGRITPAQLNIMSSTDLANEQTQAEIEAAEAEALHHSIMPKLQAPSAKMTHKGIEMIEENISETRYQDYVRQEEEERIESERRERERLARERERSASMALPPTPVDANAPASAVPHSPVVSTVTNWGAPPPLPAPSVQTPSSPLAPTRPPPQPLFAPSDSDLAMSMEGELSLADLINIDDDLPQDGASSTVALPQSSPDLSSVAASTPEVVTPSGPSPFALAKPLSPTRRTSFDLNALWMGGDKSSEVEESGKRDLVNNNDADEGEAMDIDSADEEETEDRTLDAILDDAGPQSADEPSLPPPPPKPLDLDQLKTVWSGTLSMPYDANTVITPSVIAKQVGGRTLASSSSAWKSLFPTSDARIDGRVPVPNSSQYLINMRLNATKELIAVCLRPESEEHVKKFDELSDFLVKKSRHGLIFPWGMHPKPTDPGRELYIIPMKKDEPVPEYIELLDNLQLPMERPDNVIIGVFVLSKGKLKDEPEPTVASVAPVQPSASVPIPSNITPPPVVSQPPISSILANLPRVPGVDQSALAAEVASLTPEQISIMLRTLSQSVPAPAIPPVPVHLPAPPPMPMSSAPLPPHGYPPPLAMPPFAPNLHHSPVQRSPQGHSPPRPPYGQMGPRNGYDDRYDDRYEGRPYEKDNGGRGGRGRGHRPPRSFGGGRPQDGDRDRFKDRDAGWRGRGRG